MEGQVVSFIAGNLENDLSLLSSTQRALVKSVWCLVPKLNNRNTFR